MGHVAVMAGVDVATANQHDAVKHVEQPTEILFLRDGRKSDRNAA